jgi:hypothetical protein
VTGQGLAPALRRLLGPGRPEVSCEVCFEELDRFVDLELTGADVERSVPGMAAHLLGCPACAEEHASLTALLIGGAPLPPPPPRSTP